MISLGFQGFRKIKRIRNFRHSSKKKYVFILIAFLHALLYRPDNRRAGPGFIIMVAFMLANITNLVREDKVVFCYVIKLTYRIIIYKFFYDPLVFSHTTNPLFKLREQ